MLLLKITIVKSFMAIPTLIIEWFSQPYEHSKNAECREYLREGKLIVQD